MNKTVIGVIALSLTGAAARSQERAERSPCEDTATQYEMNACTQKEFARADAELNEAYRALASALAKGAGGEARRLKLQAAQRLWLKYRDTNCESESSIYEGGTIRPAIYSMCLTSVTRERTKRLKAFLAETMK